MITKKNIVNTIDRDHFTTGNNEPSTLLDRDHFTTGNNEPSTLFDCVSDQLRIHLNTKVNTNDLVNVSIEELRENSQSYENVEAMVPSLIMVSF